MIEPNGRIDDINRWEVGNHPYLAELMSFSGHEILATQVALEPVTVQHYDYQQALREINGTWGAITDPKTGRSYEIAITNPTAPPEDGFDIEFATEKSSLSNNPGNAREFAANSAVYPGRKRVYIGSPGNGLSSDFDPDEHKYIRETGRLMRRGGQPLPTFAGLARALEAADLSVEPGVRLSGNSGGAAYARGLMAALGYDTVTHAYLKNSPGVTHHRAAVVWSTLALVRDLIDDNLSARRSEDPWKLTSEEVDGAKALLPRIYGEHSTNQQQTKAQQARTSHSPSKLVTTALMLAGGRENEIVHPAAADTDQALEQQPNALVTAHFSLYDRLSSGRSDIQVFLEQVHRLGGVAAAGRAEVVVVTTSGTHRDHTAYPSMRWAAESRAFARTRAQHP